MFHLLQLIFNLLKINGNVSWGYIIAGNDCTNFYSWNIFFFELTS